MDRATRLLHRVGLKLSIIIEPDLDIRMDADKEQCLGIEVKLNCRREPNLIANERLIEDQIAALGDRGEQAQANMVVFIESRAHARDFTVLARQSKPCRIPS